MKSIVNAPDFTISAKLVNLFKFVGVAYILTFVIFLAAAAFLTYTEFPQGMIPSVVVITTMISIMFAGSGFARSAKNKGWFNGMLAGLIYMVILYVISSLTLNTYGIDINGLIMLILGMAAGAFGGVVGINLKMKKR
jgi:putative membrane protein (TIGR04086 family)